MAYYGTLPDRDELSSSNLPISLPPDRRTHSCSSLAYQVEHFGDRYSGSKIASGYGPVRKMRTSCLHPISIASDLAGTQTNIVVIALDHTIPHDPIRHTPSRHHTPVQERLLLFISHHENVSRQSLIAYCHISHFSNLTLAHKASHLFFPFFVHHLQDPLH